MNRDQYVRNAASPQREEDFFAPKVFSTAAKWLDENRDWERWLVVDSFDVHEPFHYPELCASRYTCENVLNFELINWPYYGRIDQSQSRLTERQVAFVRVQYAGKKPTMVNRWFGEVLGELDELSLWENRAVIVTSDHGHFLGDHGWMSRPDAPLHDVLAKAALFVWYPGGLHNVGGISALTSAVDLYATMVEALGVDVPENVHGRRLLHLLRGDTNQHREWTPYGYSGSTVKVTGGHYTYLHPCRSDVDACYYSPVTMNSYGPFVPTRPQKEAESGDFLPYTDSPVWRHPASRTPGTKSLCFSTLERIPSKKKTWPEGSERRGAYAGASDRSLATA